MHYGLETEIVYRSISNKMCFICTLFFLVNSFAAEIPKSQLVANPSQTKSSNRSRFFGSNISATTSTLQKGDATLGFQITGYGVSDRLFIGTSPWMAWDYKLYHLGVRYRFYDSANEKAGYTAHYFKSFNGDECLGSSAYYYVDNGSEFERKKFCGLYSYKQENFWNVWTYEMSLTSATKIFLNQHVNYYWDQTRPYSMRRPSNDKTPWQLTSTVMIQSFFAGDYFIASELGLLDWEKNPVHVHSSLMLGALKKTFSFHAGVSVISAATAFSSPNKYDYQQALRYSKEGFNAKLDEEKISSDFSIHPEVTGQFYF